MTQDSPQDWQVCEGTWGQTPSIRTKDIPHTSSTWEVTGALGLWMRGAERVISVDTHFV